MYEHLPLNAAARAYLCHHHMVYVIANNLDGDQHVKEKDSLHCNVCQKSVVTYNKETSIPTGILIAEQPIGVTELEQPVGGKYPILDVS